jgi:hypothetical protein
VLIRPDSAIDLHFAVDRQVAWRSAYKLHLLRQLKGLKTQADFARPDAVDIAFKNHLVNAAQGCTRGLHYELPGSQGIAIPSAARPNLMPDGQTG